MPYNIWWDLSGPFKTLHYINLVRLNYIIKQSQGIRAKKILDIGCGGGILSESMSKAGAIVTGLDINFNAIQSAKSHAKKQKLQIHYLQETIKTHTKLNQNVYDIITCMEVIEHTLNPKSIVQSCSKLVKKNGSIFFSTINRTFKSWLFIIFGAEYLFKIIPKGTHNIKKFIQPSELMRWTDTFNLIEKNISGLCFNPITNQCKLTNNINMNYILHVQRL